MSSTAIQERIDSVRDRVDIVALIGREVRLSRHSKPRGKCPFHGSKSDSLAVYPEGGRARCWGCGWSGDAIGFVRDFYGLDFMGALERLEGDLGLDGLAARPVRREKVLRQARDERKVVDSGLVAEHLWAAAVPDPDSLRIWLRARGVPEAMLSDRWLGGPNAQLRFCVSAPISAWPIGKDHTAVARAPAMVGLVRRIAYRPPAAEGCDRANGPAEGGAVPPDRFMVPCGVHATYLSPGLKAKMNRKRADGSAVAARKMFGGCQGGFVLIGRYSRDCPLFVGEGIETVLSGMALAGAGEDACGLAVLSLDNLQGRARRWRNGVLPLHDVRPDPESACVAFAHDGPVTGLIDADMAPLRGWRNPQTGEPMPPALVERPGGPVVRRAITTAERAAICAALFAQRWRAAGCRRVTAIRPKMGMDFNDAARSFDGAQDARRRA